MTETLLATLAAESAIRRLISAYSDAVGRRDVDSAGALFAPDASIRIAGGPELAGRVAIVEGMRQTLTAFSFLHQKCDAGLIDVEGDRARARLGVFETNRVSGADSLSMIFGVYEDEYALLEQGWRFQRRCFTLQLRGAVPVSKLQQFPDFVPAFSFTA